MDIKLKPCPFCGKQAEVFFEPNESDSNDECKWVVVCNGCASCGGYWKEKEKSIDAWNCRNELENKPLSLEELKQRDTTPVYCIGIKNAALTGYGLVDTADKRINDFCCDFWPFEDYEKEYIAYDHKPEQEDSKC